jgi:hypothetical protein
VQSRFVSNPDSNGLRFGRQNGIHLVGRFALHFFEEVAVGVHRELTRRAPQQREVFTLSRELEYFSADELEKQAGYGRDEWWP